jgi:hypothetical protein
LYRRAVCLNVAITTEYGTGAEAMYPGFTGVEWVAHTDSVGPGQISTPTAS